MSIVRLEPVGQPLQVNPGQTLMAAAQSAGYRWPSMCGGFAICGTCATRVLEGAENADPPSPLEARRLSEIHIGREGQGAVRLACQLLPGGPMTVFKFGVRKQTA